MTLDDRYFLGLAIEQARIGWDEGGVPIGAALDRTRPERTA
ncbi:hypothetical protein GCM10027062_02500 [Nocardioides hungaricus]